MPINIDIRSDMSVISPNPFFINVYRRPSAVNFHFAFVSKPGFRKGFYE